MKQHRLVILGDPHISESEKSFWEEEIIPDLNELEPDRVLVMGDLSGDPGAGTRRNTARAVEVLSRLDAPWTSIIGNHDLQAAEFATDEEAVRMMLDFLGRDEPGFALDIGPFSVIGLSNTFWRRNSVNKNEIVIDSRQIAWWRAELAKRQDRPVVMLCHAPPIGSGLIAMQELHARVGNAYVNQNHVPGEILQVIWENPNILFWFSAHNHLGQHYRDAITCRLGVNYVHTGTASRTSCRDACRHSRILEIGERGFTIRTFDHGLRAVDETLDYPCPFGLGELVDQRRRLAGKRFIPCDPRTMNHGRGIDARSPRLRRFAFLSDAHTILPMPKIQRRIANWCARQIRAHAPDRLILGGDLTHRPEPEAARAFLDSLAIRDIPIDYLPGNNEGRAFEFSLPRLVRGCVALEECAGKNVFLLATGDPEEAAEAVDQLLACIPAEGSCLVFAHFPPELAGADRLERLENGNIAIFWVCGHGHAALDYRRGRLRVHASGGLDPIKVQGEAPELLMVDWDGESPSIERLNVPEQFLRSTHDRLEALNRAPAPDTTLPLVRQSCS